MVGLAVAPVGHPGSAGVVVGSAAIIAFATLVGLQARVLSRSLGNWASNPVGVTGTDARFREGVGQAAGVAVVAKAVHSSA